MKKALMKDSIKEIKNTYKRFLSILLMAFLGVGFFAGIKATSPDMVNTIDKFYKDQNVYDMQVISTLGLTGEDIEALSSFEDVEQVVGSYEMDGKIDIDNKEIIVKSISIEDINKPILIEGKLPEAQDECVVEESFLKVNQKQIGDTLELEIENQANAEGEEIEYLKQKNLKIVGTVQSTLYISRDRGTSKLGAGKINYFIYLPKESINATDIYTSIYIKVKKSNEYTTSSKKYEDYIESVKSKIEAIKEEREKARYDELVNTATQKLQEAENTLNKEKEDAESKIGEAEKEIADGKDKIEKAEAELKESQQKAQSEFANAETKLKNAKLELANQEKTLVAKEQEANSKFAEAEEKKQELQSNLEQVNTGLDEVNKNYEEIIQTINHPNYPNFSEEQKAIVERTKNALEAKKQELETSKAQIEAGIAQIETEVASRKTRN